MKMIWYVASVPMWIASLWCFIYAVGSFVVSMREHNQVPRDQSVILIGAVMSPLMFMASSGCAWLAAKIMEAS